MFYLINKPKNISSFKFIRKFAFQNQIKKIGHTGTLDPLASGLLLVATDEDTKLIHYIDQGFKSYIVEMELGKISDTLDVTGQIEIINFDFNEKINIKKKILSFEKIYFQKPPFFSAKKVNGKRAYDLARKNIKFDLKKQKVEIKKIFNIEQIDIKKYKFEIIVSRGTYIRSIVHEIGQNIGCGAIMTNLIRNKIGNLGFESINKSLDWKKIIDLPILKIKNIDLIDSIFHGKKNIEIEKKDGQYILFYQNQIMGIVKIIKNILFTDKLFGLKYKRLKNDCN